ncbi:hypothetical protein PV327_001098 [Microctonus hyperodae]|uniref:Uncharacterized protein n=1 Tax=Microctonus hyperodae TaxID=165561 RepID=A0AA39G8H3_MICHY|nr:hypothetical protein PV327_001098 [Microctonus hyperodae]
MDDLPTNDFVERCRRDCIIKRDTVVCGKYRVVRWLHDVAREKELSYGPFKVIKIPSTNQASILPELPKTRNLKFGVSETLNFVRDIAEHLIKRRAIIYTYEPVLFNSRSFNAGPMILDEDELEEMQRGRTLSDNSRLFKKKKIIFPIVVLVELFKLKLMLIPIFLGVHLIKKLIIIGGLFVPGLLSKLRICKVPQPSHPFHAWSTAGETPVDYPTGYGHDDPGWSHRNDIYPIAGYGGGYHNSHSPYSYYRQRR